MNNKKKQLLGRGKLIAGISVMEKILQEEQNQKFEKRIAQAILDAQKMHEESYVPNLEKVDDDRLRTDFGEYTKDFEECFQVTCKQQNLSPNMWSLLCLANH